MTLKTEFYNSRIGNRFIVPIVLILVLSLVACESGYTANAPNYTGSADLSILKGEINRAKKQVFLRIPRV